MIVVAFELSAPILHKVLNYELLKSHVWGGKGVGSQGEGTAQFVARSAPDQQAVVEIIERDLGMSCLKLTLRPSQTINKAVIPAAGFGTRLFPATKATKKELFPVIDQDGIAKPAILLIVEEALSAGLENVVIIVQEHDLLEFQSFFNEQITIENYNKLPQHFQQYARRILDMGHRVSFAIQTTQEGFGHAVYCSRQAVSDPSKVKSQISHHDDPASGIRREADAVALVLDQRENQTLLSDGLPPRS